MNLVLVVLVLVLGAALVNTKKELAAANNKVESVKKDRRNLILENAELKDKCSNLQESVAYYKTLESGIEKTISNAKEQADTIKEIAMKEAVNLKAEQELAFQAKIKEYDEKIREKELEFENIKKQMQIYKIKIQSMMEAQLKLLEDCDN